jgi:hypothetical protein
VIIGAGYTVSGNNNWTTYTFTYTPSNNESDNFAIDLGQVNGQINIGAISIKP